MAPRSQNREYGTSLHYEPEFKGPRGKRSCTDVLCLLLFVIAIGVWGYVGYYALRNGDPDRLIVPTDSNGRRCGKDSEVVKKRYLFFFDLTQCIPSPDITSEKFLDGCTTTQICLEKCPTEAWSAYSYLNNPGKPFDKVDVQKNIICKDGESSTIEDVNRLRNLVDSGKCAPWQISSHQVYGRCLPSFQEIKKMADFLNSMNMSVEAVKKATEVVQKLSSVNEFTTRVQDDLLHTWQYLVIGLLIAMFISLLYITMLRWLAGLMIWVSLFAITILLGFGVYVCYAKYQYTSSLPEEPPSPPGRRTIRTRIQDFFEKKSTWIVLMVFTSVLLVVVILVLIFLRQRISIAITLIKEGSKAVGSVISALFFPVFPWILQLVVAIYFIAVALHLASIGHDTFKVFGVNNNSNCVCDNNFYKDKDICSVEEFNKHCRNPVDGGDCLKAGCIFISLESDDFITYLQLYNLFVMFWGLWFLSGLAQMILAATFATWYWTFHKRNLPFFTLTASIYRSVRYHLGTVAFGSLIIAICSFIRAIIEFIELKLKRYDNAFTRAIFCLLRCCFWCLHKFICFVNKNAYIMCAIHGKNFCSSAQEAFFLLMRNVIRVVVVDKVTDFLFFLGKVVITAIVMVGAYFVFQNPVRLLDNSARDVTLNYTFVPVAALGVGTYLITSIFFGVYAMAVDTLFLCFLEDCERNDGSPEKPYFMSTKLMKILGKKNKLP